MLRLLYLRWHARQLRRAIDNIRGNLAEALLAEEQFTADLRRVQAQISMLELERRYAPRRAD
jgi:hypothetical protein